MSAQIAESEIENTSRHESRRSTAHGHSSDMSDYQKQLWIRKLTQTEGCFESPIDVSITKSKEIELPPLEWNNFEIPPKKIKITNTGQTIGNIESGAMLPFLPYERTDGKHQKDCHLGNSHHTSFSISAKWGQERPHICNGPFLGKYVFSNWHLHWGPNDMEGSEHSVDGAKYPAEMHVVTFKSCYLTQEAALKEQDGCATLVYFFKLQDAPNPAFQTIVDALLDIPKAGTSKKIEPTIITNLVREFVSDYFMYWGSVSTEKCVHYILWMITRIPIGVTADQIDSLRFIFDETGNPLTRNFRNVNTHKRSVFHVNPSSSKYSTLLPLANGFHDVVQLFRCESTIGNEVNIPDINISNSHVVLKPSQKKKQLEETGQKIDFNKYIFQQAMVINEEENLSQDTLSSQSNNKLGEKTRENLKKYIFAF